MENDNRTIRTALPLVDVLGGMHLLGPDMYHFEGIEYMHIRWFESEGN
jgi:hypothetical protein